MTTKAKKSDTKSTTIHMGTAGGSGRSICGRKGGSYTTDSTGIDIDCPACLKILAHADAKAKDKKATKTKAEPTSKPEPQTLKNATVEATLEVGSAKPKAPRAAKQPAAKPARERDPRLPEIGTILSKTNRAGKKVTCTVTALGACYKGSEFKSLSAAAVAAAKDLGISGSQNGYIFWGLVKPRPAIKDPVEALTKAWGRYEATLRAIVGPAGAQHVPAEVAAKIAPMLKVQAEILKAVL